MIFSVKKVIFYQKNLKQHTLKVAEISDIRYV